MARFLTPSTRGRVCLALTFLIITLLMATYAVPVFAGHYYGWFTAYAMGNRYGGAGVEIRQGHFANHYYNWRPSGPACSQGNCWVDIYFGR
ncbi:MAG: hypothetical protein ABIN58_01565 [candidate division WOR-3 bacterium]